MNRTTRLKTKEIMKCLSVATLMKPPPMKNGKRMKIKFATQAEANVRERTASD
jgi:predicted GTPase